MYNIFSGNGYRYIKSFFSILFQGICPGNRLRIMNSYDSGCFSLSPTSSPCRSLAASTATLNSSILSSDIYENTQQIQNNNNKHVRSTSLATSVYSRCSLQSSTYGQGNRRSWHVSPLKVSWRMNKFPNHKSLPLYVISIINISCLINIFLCIQFNIPLDIQFPHKSKNPVLSVLWHRHCVVVFKYFQRYFNALPFRLVWFSVEFDIKILH